MGKLYALISMVNMWGGCISSSEPTAGFTKHDVWTFCLPALSWTVHNAFSCVRHTLLEAILVYMALIFVHTQCFYPDYYFLFFMRGSLISGGEAYRITCSFFLYGEQTQSTVWWSFLKLVQWDCWILSALKNENWCYCLLFIAEWKHKGPSMCCKSVFLHKDQRG